MMSPLLLAAALTFPTPLATSPTPQPPTAPAVVPAAREPALNSANTPVPHPGCPACMKMHESFNKIAQEGHEKGNIDVIFLGDSITDYWRHRDGPFNGKAVWDAFYAPRHAVNFGIGGDRTQHVLWRVQNGNLDGLAHPLAGSPPRLLVLMIGTNNSNGSDNTAEEIASGITAIVKECQSKLPTTKILILAIFPRGDQPNAQREKNAKASELASKLADDKTVFYLDIGKAFLKPDGSMDKTMMPDNPPLHPNEKGYKAWAEAMEPTVRRLLGEDANAPMPVVKDTPEPVKIEPTKKSDAPKP